MNPRYRVKPKVKAAGFAGALTVLIVFVSKQLGVDLTAEVAAALTTVIGTLAGFLKSD